MSEHGTYETVDGRPAVRFERRLGHPPDAVWRSITEPSELAHWFPCAVEVAELRPGAPMRFVFDEDTAYEGEVLEADEPRALAFRWGADLLRFELEPAGDGTVLRMLHVLHEEGPEATAKTAAGWHLCLDALADALDGRPQPVEEEHPPPGWRAAYEDYVEAGFPSGAPVPEA